MLRKCRRCGAGFEPHQWNHVFCGSKIQQTGCSWLNLTSDRIKRRWQNEKYRAYQKEYGKIWKRIQRKLNADYAVRQRLLKREAALTPEGKKVAQAWRRRNLVKVLFWNKKRARIKRGVVGSHTFVDWVSIKSKYNYCCAICKLSESDLRKKWKNTHFTELTMDHILPISKGGTDYITNIQPLCISCNAKKRDA